MKIIFLLPPSEAKNNWGDYCKENCRWATRKEQGNNTRVNKMVTYKWETLTLTLMARKYNKNERLIKERLHKLWWTIKEAIETKLLNKSERLHTNK